MKNIKKILAVLMVICLVAGLAACHKKGETAVTVKYEDTEFTYTSGYYACVLYFADSEAREKVKTQLSDAGEDTGNIDYLSQEIDGKSYTDWVKDEALNDIKHIAACKLCCQIAELELSEEQISNSKANADYYWESYGYSEILTKNGVAKETFIEYSKDLLYEELYFDHIFGAEGEKAITEEQLKNELTSSFVLADVLSVVYEDDENGNSNKEEVDSRLTGYYNDLRRGKTTFEDVYYDNSGTEKTETTEDDGTAKPEDTLATMIGKPDTDYAGTYSDYFETINAMKTGEVKLIDNKDSTGKILIVKKDILADSYYYTAYEDTFRHILADDDFKAIIDEFAEKISLDEESYATDRFEVKEIYHAS